MYISISNYISTVENTSYVVVSGNLFENVDEYAVAFVADGTDVTIGSMSSSELWLACAIDIS